MYTKKLLILIIGAMSMVSFGLNAQKYTSSNLSKASYKGVSTGICTDSVKIGDSTSETAHNLLGASMSTGTFGGKITAQLIMDGFRTIWL